MASAHPQHITDERRWTLGAWITLAVAAGYLVWGMAYVLVAYSLPSEGWNSVYTASTGWEVKVNQGGSDLLRPGDRILAVAGQDVDSSFTWRLIPPHGWEAGGSARYTVRRGNALIELDLPLVQIAPGELPRHMLVGTDGTNFAALICVLFGFTIFLLRPGNVAARLLLLMLTYFMGTAMIWFAVSGPAQFFHPPPLYWSYQGTGMLWPLLFAAATHLALSFPRKVWPLTRRPHLALGLLYGLPALVAAATLATFSFVVFGGGLIAMMLTMVCAVAGATVYNLRTARDPSVRAQIGWVGLGFGATFIVAVVSAIVGLIVPGAGEWGGYLFFLALPICLGVAILRYRLLDIEVVIRRTLVYSALTLSLGAVYLASVVVLQALFVRLTGEESTLAVVASTLAIAALFGPLRRRVQSFIDRRFFPRKYDGRRVLEAFALRAQREADLEALSAAILHVVQETLEPEQAHIWVRRG